MFDDGDEITHKVQDVSAVIKNRKIPQVGIGQHVLVNWNGGVKYYIGYVTAKAPNDQYTVTFDDNDEASYHAVQLTEFPDHRSAYKGKEGLYNNYSMSPRWIRNDKITNERVARVGYNHFISNKGEWNNCFSKFSNRVLPPNFISTILQSENF